MRYSRYSGTLVFSVNSLFCPYLYLFFPFPYIYMPIKIYINIWLWSPIRHLMSLVIIVVWYVYDIRKYLADHWVESEARLNWLFKENSLYTNHTCCTDCWPFYGLCVVFWSMKKAKTAESSPMTRRADNDICVSAMILFETFYCHAAGMEPTKLDAMASQASYFPT